MTMIALKIYEKNAIYMIKRSKKMEMLFDRVLAKKIVAQNTTKSGLVVLNDDKTPTLCQAKVENVGQGSYEYGVFIPMQIDVGDTIFYEPHTAVQLNLQGEEYVILRQIDVIMKEKK